MQATNEHVFCFGDCTLDLRRGALRRADREIDLRPKSFELLRYLIKNAGRLVSKDELIEAVWPNVTVSDESLTRCVSDVRQALSDVDQSIIKTVPRRGYLFAAPVFSETVGPEKSAIKAAPTDASAAVPLRLSIVVLPFVNLGGDKKQDYFVEGITESLTTDLSRIPGAFVIARNTAITYKGKLVDARQIGHELGVRYVMEGSVQTGRDRIRVNAQLIDTETGAHLWAERFDKPRADLFDMQDEITARLARTVGVELVSAEARRVERQRPHNMNAIDLTMRGRAIRARDASVASAREAQALFEAALQHDDRNLEALIGLADTHLSEVLALLSDEPAQQIRSAEAAISKALMLAPEDARAHLERGLLLRALRAPEQALREFELALRLDPNLVSAHVQIGQTKLLLGRAEEMEAAVAEAMRLSPRDARLGEWYIFMGAADLFLGRLTQAVDRLRKSIEVSPSTEIAYFLLAAALGLAGRDNEAAQACAAGLRLSPRFTIAKFRAGVGSDNPVYLARRERLYEGMRKAGVPEE